MTTAKIDYQREWGELYRAGSEPRLVEVPPLTYAMLDGEGDPAGDGQAEAIEALEAFSSAAEAVVRERTGFDYVVLPLEGRWWAADMAAYDADPDRAQWRWTMMIAQPFPLDDVLDEVRERAARRSPAVARLRLEPLEEGWCAQVLHVGPYDDEGPVIARLHAFIAAQGREPAGRHHEIYLSDPRRTPPERLRTILRQPLGGPARTPETGSVR